MRSPRRTFTAPFVITVVGASASAGFTSCNPPAQQRPDPLIATNPPEPQPDPTTDPGQPDGTATDTTPPAEGERRWTLFQRGEDCFAGMKIECPKPAHEGDPIPTCNPPPPVKYACPENLSLERPIEIAQWKGDTTCHVVQPPVKCPEHAMCNPPPPRQVDCPSR